MRSCLWISTSNGVPGSISNPDTDTIGDCSLLGKRSRTLSRCATDCAAGEFPTVSHPDGNMVRRWRLCATIPADNASFQVPKCTLATASSARCHTSRPSPAACRPEHGAGWAVSLTVRKTIPERKSFGLQRSYDLSNAWNAFGPGSKKIAQQTYVVQRAVIGRVKSCTDIARHRSLRKPRALSQDGVRG